MHVQRVVDLSRALGPGMQVYPGDPEVRFTAVATIDADGFWLNELTLGSQSGTHVDAPAHVVQGADETDLISPRSLVAPAWIVDVTATAPLGLIEPETLAPTLRKARVGDAVVLRSGWDRFDGRDQAWSHPGLSVAGAQALVRAGVSFIGLDFASVDRHGEAGLPAHQVLAHAGVPIVENLANLDQVTWDLPLVVVGMLPLAGLDGAPARVFAIELEATPRPTSIGSTP